MSDMNFICPTCKRPTHPTDNEIIEYLAKEIERYTDVLVERTKELDRTQKALKQSEICCTEWEKQALDYKAENIALSGDLERTRKALEFITRISGAGMSYQDMFIDAHEVAKFALGQVKYPILIGRYDKEMTDLLRGDDNE